VRWLYLIVWSRVSFWIWWVAAPNLVLSVWKELMKSNFLFRLTIHRYTVRVNVNYRCLQKVINYRRGSEFKRWSNNDRGTIVSCIVKMLLGKDIITCQSIFYNGHKMHHKNKCDISILFNINMFLSRVQIFYFSNRFFVVLNITQCYVFIITLRNHYLQLL